jgi:hypothetical protein
MYGVCVDSGEENILMGQVTEIRNIYIWGFTICIVHQTLAYYVVKF